MRASSVATRRTSRTARAELHALGDDLRAILLLPILFPAARLQTPFHKSRRTLFEVLIDGISLPAEDNDIVKICLLLLFAIFADVDAVGGNRKVAHIHARGKRAQFRIASEIAE